MIQRSLQSANSAPNWHALSLFPHLLVRRSPEPDQWVIAGRGDDMDAVEAPSGMGPWIGHFGFEWPGGIDQPQRSPKPEPWGSSHWWRPELMMAGALGHLATLAENGPGHADSIQRTLWRAPTPFEPPIPSSPWQRRTSKERYLRMVDKLLGHIQRGDIYEVNYCTERSAVLEHFDPFTAFGRLLQRTDAPYAALYRRKNLFALCMSPESFLRIEADRAITHPMKGTRSRSPDPELDRALALELMADRKERSENIMAVDVARHDLSRIAASGSVKVDELCAVKSHPRVHQLVSTVSARVREGVSTQDVLRATFPMASMTGAPKGCALSLIDAVEDQPRGLFSGSIGYQLPNGTVDLNVVIRTILFDASTGHASLITGSAITAQSDPEKEWEECELKARSVLDALL